MIAKLLVPELRVSPSTTSRWLGIGRVALRAVAFKGHCKGARPPLTRWHHASRDVKKSHPPLQLTQLQEGDH